MITNEQREARKQGIGGSDMPIILGLSNYKTPYQLFLEKLGLLEGDELDSPFQYWGNKLEPVIIEEFSTRNNLKVETPDTIVHPMYDFLRGNVDGFIPENNHVLEVKCSNQFMASEWGESGSDVIPMPYLVQVAHYVSCMNADGAYIAVLIGGYDYREFKYTRDLQLEAHIIDAAKSFWNSVQTNQAPDAIKQIDLKLMFPTHEPSKTVKTNEDIRRYYDELVGVKSDSKALSEREDDLKFKIMEHMQDAECLTDSEGKPLCTWKANKRGSRTFLLKGI